MQKQKKKNIIEMKMKHIATIFVLGAFLITAAFFVRRDDRAGVILGNLEKSEMSILNTTAAEKEESSPVSRCDLFSGRWVFDDMARRRHPMYEEGVCSFMRDEFACQKFGRKNTKYQQWRWQPNDCDLPRFNGKVLMEKMRGKRVVFVGDSLNKNQWTSLLCLIESSLDRSSSKSVFRRGNLLVFEAHEYNATIEFYWSPLMVESNCDDPDQHRQLRDRVVRITSIEKHARHWIDADVLVFDSFLWWLEPTMTILWGSFGKSDGIYKKVEMRARRYEMALNTWSDWLEINVNRTKTKMFFMSLSPYHFEGESLFDREHCYNQTEPIAKEDYWGSSTNREMMRIAESSIQKLEERGVRVEYLNITHMSDYRRDAHPSIYRKHNFHPPSKEELLAWDPRNYMDCAHWCLPGVPDVWNQIFINKFRPYRVLGCVKMRADLK